MTSVVPGERARPAWVRGHPRAWLAAVLTVCFGAFMGQLDASIVALTYHSIGEDFGSGLSSVQVISLTYLVALGALLIPLGRLSDRVGRKRIYLWGFGLFTIASAACSLAPSLPALATLRAVQGAGAAMLQANGVALVVTSAPRHRRRTALGMQAAAQAIGLALGPSIGGLIVETLGWRAVFYLNVPVGVVAIVAGHYLLPRTRRSAPRAVGLRTVLRVPGVRRGLLGALLAYLLLFGPIVLVPSVLQSHGRSPLVAGLVVAALPVAFALGAVLGERLLPCDPASGRRCRRSVVFVFAGLAGLLIGPSGPLWALSLVVAGFGLGTFTPANNAHLMADVPDDGAALAGSLVSVSRTLGTAAGTVLVASTLGIAPSGLLAAGALLLFAAGAAATVPPARQRGPGLSAGRRDPGR
jgi:MFS family permease